MSGDSNSGDRESKTKVELRKSPYDTSFLHKGRDPREQSQEQHTISSPREQSQEQLTISSLGESRKSKELSPSDAARKEYAELGIPPKPKSKSKPFDPIKRISYALLHSSDAQAKAKAAQEKAIKEAIAESTIGDAGNSLYITDDIMLKHLKQEQEKLHKELAQSLVDDLGRRGKFVRGIAEARTKELLNQSYQEDPTRHIKEHLWRNRKLSVKKWMSGKWGMILDMSRRSMNVRINRNLQTLLETAEAVHGYLDHPDTNPHSQENSNDSEMPSFSYLTLQDIKTSFGSEEARMGNSPTGDAVRNRLKKFMDYYTKRSILENAEHGIRAQIAVYKAEEGKLESDFENLYQDYKHLLRTENEEVDYFNDDLIKELHNQHLQHLNEERKAELEKDIGSKAERIKTLRDKILELQNKLVKVKDFYEELEEQQDYKDLMETLIKREQAASSEGQPEELQIPWGAAITTPYRFVHKVRRESVKNARLRSICAKLRPEQLTKYLSGRQALSQNPSLSELWNVDGEGSIQVNQGAFLDDDFLYLHQDSHTTRLPIFTGQDLKRHQDEKTEITPLPDAPNHTRRGGDEGHPPSHQTEGTKELPKRQSDAPHPPLFDLTQIKNANISYLAATLNDPDRRDPDNPSKALTYDSEGNLTIEWIYSHDDGGYWCHHVNDSEILVIRTNGMLERYPDDPDQDELIEIDLGDPFKDYLQAYHEKKLPAFPAPKPTEETKLADTGDTNSTKADLPKRQSDAPRPPLFDLTQITDNNISHLAKALNDQKQHAWDTKKRMWSTLTRDSDGNLTRKWFYHSEGQDWYHFIEGDHKKMLAIELSDGKLELVDIDGQMTDPDDNIFGSYLQAPLPERESRKLPLVSEMKPADTDNTGADLTKRQSDAPRPPLFDYDQIANDNISHLAQTLDNPARRDQIDRSKARTHDPEGNLTIEWIYDHKEQYWYYDIPDTDEMLLIRPSDGKLERHLYDPEEQQWTEIDLGDPFKDLLQAHPDSGVSHDMDQIPDMDEISTVREITQMVRKLGPEDICVGNADEVGEWTTSVAFRLDGGKIQLAENPEELAKYLNSQGYVKIAGQEITDLEQTTQLLSDNRPVELEMTDSRRIQLELLELEEAEQDLKEMLKPRQESMIQSISNLSSDKPTFRS